MGKIQEFCKNHIVDVFMCVAVLFFVVGCWCLYTANRTANDYSDVHESVERTEAGIDRAGKRLDSAQTEIKNAEVHIRRADKTSRELTKRSEQNTRELDECQRLVDGMSKRAERIQGIIADVEKSNQDSEAQTNRDS